MALTRKRRRELKKLKSEVNDVWQEQKDVLDEARKVLNDARRQAINFHHEELRPRVRDAYESRVAPVVNTGVSATKRAASSTRDVFLGGVLPAVTAAVGSTIAAIDVSRDPHVRSALKHVREASAKLTRNVAPVAPPKSSPGFGTYLLIGIGVVAVAAVGYALWQTLSADDDLWIEDEPDANPGV